MIKVTSGNSVNDFIVRAICSDNAVTTGFFQNIRIVSKS